MKIEIPEHQGYYWGNSEAYENWLPDSSVTLLKMASISQLHFAHIWDGNLYTVTCIEDDDSIEIMNLTHQYYKETDTWMLIKSEDCFIIEL